MVGNLAAGVVAARMLSSFGWESIFVVGGMAPLLRAAPGGDVPARSSQFEAIRWSLAPAATGASTRSRLAALFADGAAGPTSAPAAINFSTF